jgi:hypothetical protein
MNECEERFHYLTSLGPILSFHPSTKLYQSIVCVYICKYIKITVTGTNHDTSWFMIQSANNTSNHRFLASTIAVLTARVITFKHLYEDNWSHIEKRATDAISSWIDYLRLADARSGRRQRKRCNRDVRVYVNSRVYPGRAAARKCNPFSRSSTYPAGRCARD